MAITRQARTTTTSLRSSSVRRQARFVLKILAPFNNSILVGAKAFPLTFQADTIKAFNAGFVSILDDVRKTILQIGHIDFKGRNYDFLDLLRDKGAAAYQGLWPKALKEYFRSKEDEQVERGLSFTFQVEEGLSLYWEMLYRGDPRKKPKTSDFWGFRYPIGRCYFEIDPQDRVSLQGGMLSAIHTKLTLSRREVEAVRGYLAGLHLGPSVSVQMLDEALKSKAATVNELLDLFHDDEFPFGVVHFACHCDVGENPLASALSLTSRDKEIELLLEQVVGNVDYGFRNQPLVFLNACQTADVEGLRAGLGFPRAVLNFGAAGVIATACVVPDTFASAFAKEFYRRLLIKREAPAAANIAVVLMETRQHFLDEYENPMGLAYGLYAGSDQEFRV
jgi:hypothetical protein